MLHGILFGVEAFVTVGMGTNGAWKSTVRGCKVVHLPQVIPEIAHGFEPPATALAQASDALLFSDRIVVCGVGVVWVVCGTIVRNASACIACDAREAGVGIARDVTAGIACAALIAIVRGRLNGSLLGHLSDEILRLLYCDSFGCSPTDVRTVFVPTICDSGVVLRVRLCASSARRRIASPIVFVAAGVVRQLKASSYDADARARRMTLPFQLLL